MTQRIEQLSKNDTGYRDLFNLTGVGLLVTDVNGIVVEINPYAERQFGYGSSEIIGQSLEIIFPKISENDAMSESQAGHLNEDRAKYFTENQIALRKDGKPFPVAATFGRFEVENELRNICFVRDIESPSIQNITIELCAEEIERRVQERTRCLEEQLAKEREMNEMKSRFVAMASHEFRTPLSAILSSVTLASKYTLTEHQDQRDRHLERIRSSVYSLVDILNDFLSLDKLETGKIKTNKERLNIVLLAEDVIQETQCMRKGGQHVNYRHNGEDRLVSDGKVLRQIMINLLSNALKYSTREVDLYTEISGGELLIRVRDHGIGIPKEERSNMFDPFFRARNTNNIQGTGLGLNIVKKYVELMGGTIGYVSEENVGTTFFVNIPRKKGES